MVDRIMVEGLTAFARFTGWLKRERGQDVMEYALLSGGIALAIAAVLLVAPIRTSVQAFATAVGNCIDITADPYVCP